MRRNEAGLTTVEFAVVGSLAFLVLFGCLEVGRMLFVWNTLVEATRIGARVAAVSATDGSAARTAAMIFGSEIAGLDADDFTVEYLDEVGAATGTLSAVRYVRVSVTYTHDFFVPFVGGQVTAPTFSTTIPSESLGEPGAS